MRVRSRLPAPWSSTGARSPSGAFESVQSVTLPRPVVERSAAGARRLGELYWRELERATLGLVRARPCAGTTELRLLGLRPALLRFGAPVLAVDGSSVGCVYPIRGGVLARHPAGTLSFAQTGLDAVEVSTAVSGFFPRLAARRRALLYLHVQARLHDLLARSYFARLWREAGP